MASISKTWKRHRGWLLLLIVYLPSFSLAPYFADVFLGSMTTAHSWRHGLYWWLSLIIAVAAIAFEWFKRGVAHSRTWSWLYYGVLLNGIVHGAINLSLAAMLYAIQFEGLIP